MGRAPQRNSPKRRSSTACASHSEELGGRSGAASSPAHSNFFTSSDVSPAALSFRGGDDVEPAVLKANPRDLDARFLERLNRTLETLASFEARSVPRSYPTTGA
jgi:hypothetical protein